jgi:DNA polymerase III epsilon subunit-like protein
MINYYILDTETTGLSVDVHEINQISILRLIDKEQITFQIKVKKPHVYSPQALEVQGITPEDLKKGIPIEEALEAIEVFLNEDGQKPAGRCIIAHNAPFDRKFVHRACDRAGKEFPADLWICTQSFAKRYVKKHNNSDKVAMAQMEGGVDGIKAAKTGGLKPKFGLNNFMVGVGLTPKVGAHSAEVDVQNTDVLYSWLMNSNTEYVSLIVRAPQKDGAAADVDIDDID